MTLRPWVKVLAGLGCRSFVQNGLRASAALGERVGGSRTSGTSDFIALPSICPVLTIYSSQGIWEPSISTPSCPMPLVKTPTSRHRFTTRIALSMPETVSPDVLHRRWLLVEHFCGISVRKRAGYV